MLVRARELYKPLQIHHLHAYQTLPHNTFIIVACLCASLDFMCLRESLYIVGNEILFVRNCVYTACRSQQMSYCQKHANAGKFKYIPSLAPAPTPTKRQYKHT